MDLEGRKPCQSLTSVQAPDAYLFCFSALNPHLKAVHNDDSCCTMNGKTASQKLQQTRHGSAFGAWIARG
jgi:hypothetical protein